MQLFSNYSSTTLAASITAGQTTLLVQSVAGFPSVTTASGDYFYLTLIDAVSVNTQLSPPNQREVVKVTNITGTTLTVVRGQDGTAGQAFSIGAYAELRFNAQAARDLRWQMFSVKDFGATGDGVTDDTNAIQRAANAAVAQGRGTVFFPAGQYVTTAAITATTAISFLGAGRYNSVLLAGHTGGGLVLSTAVSTAAFEIRDLGFQATVANAGTAIQVTAVAVGSNNYPNLLIENLHIHATGAAYWTRGIKIIDVWGFSIHSVYMKAGASYFTAGLDIGHKCVEGVVHDLRVLGAVSAALFSDVLCEGIYFHNCLFVSVNYGLDYTQVTQMPDLRFQDSYVAATLNAVRCTGPAGLILTGNRFDFGDGTTPIGSAAILLDTTNGAMIANNLMGYAGAAAGSIGISISNSTISTIGQNYFASFATGVLVAASCTNTTVQLNRYFACTTNVTNSAASVRVLYQYPAVRVVTAAAVTADQNDDVIVADATSNNITITLPAVNSFGAGLSRQLIVKRKDSTGNTVTIQRAGADTIDGGTTTTLGALQAKQLNGDGVSAWYIV